MLLRNGGLDGILRGKLSDWRGDHRSRIEVAAVLSCVNAHRNALDGMIACTEKTRYQTNEN